VSHAVVHAAHRASHFILVATARERGAIPGRGVSPVRRPLGAAARHVLAPTVSPAEGAEFAHAVVHHLLHRHARARHEPVQRSQVLIRAVAAAAVVRAAAGR